jgi:hypothetical protein
MKTKESLLPRIIMSEIGLYLRTIELDYNPKNNKERASLITQNFSVLCLEEDVEHYEELCNSRQEIVEDYELEDRRHSYFQSLNSNNPFN